MTFFLLCIPVYSCQTCVLLSRSDNRTHVQVAAISRTCVLLFMTDVFPGINNRTPVQRNQKFSRTCVLLFVLNDSSVQTMGLMFEKIFNLPNMYPIVYDGCFSGIDNGGTTRQVCLYKKEKLPLVEELYL